MDDRKKLKGRPSIPEGRRTQFINVRFTEDEYKAVRDLERALGISKTQIIRMRLLSGSKQTVINARELIRHLDKAGNEMARIGNNINQLAKHANTLKLQGALHPPIVENFNRLFEAYLMNQQALEMALRKIIRAMG